MHLTVLSGWLNLSQIKVKQQQTHSDLGHLLLLAFSCKDRILPNVMTNKEYANDRVLMIGSLLHCWLMLPTTSIRCHFFSAKKVLIFFLFLNENIHCGYSLEAPHWGTSNEYPQCMFWSRQALLMSTHNVCFCWDWGTSNEYPQCMFSLRNKNYVLHLK